MSKKLKKQNVRYIPLEEIKKLDNEFLTEMESVKRRLGYVRDKAVIDTFQDVLLNAYKAAIEIKTLECEVDYDIKLAEIKARSLELKPWRRGWWRRIFFLPTTNRAQDIIEERVELDADIIHTSAEKAIKTERKRFDDGNIEKLSKRELKRQAKAMLKTAIAAADNAGINEALTEPPAPASDVQTVQEPECTEAPGNNVEPSQEPPQVQQLSLEALQNVRRARPPRSCRKS